MKYLRYKLVACMQVEADEISLVQNLINDMKLHLYGEDDSFEIESIEVIEDDI